MAPWIISHFPEHRVYVEPFGGSAAVLLQKPRSWCEVYNDLEDDAVTVFEVLRDHPEEFIRSLELTPYSRSEFERSYEASDDPIERARRAVTRSFLSHGSAGFTKKHRTGFRAVSLRSNTHGAQDFANLPGALWSIVERIRGVVIEHDDAAKVMARFDAPDTLHYVDPPYPMSTRHTGAKWGGCRACYGHELSDSDHEDLAATLRGLEGMVIVSSYPSELYDELYQGWARLTCESLASGSKGAVKRTEVIYLSPSCVERTKQIDLFDRRTA